MILGGGSTYRDRAIETSLLTTVALVGAKEEASPLRSPDKQAAK